MKRSFSIAAVLFLSVFAYAEEGKPTEPSKPAAPAAPAAEKIFAPTALEELKAMKGKKISVEGPIVVQGQNKAGTIRYLNFTTNYRQSLSLVFFVSGTDSPFTKEKLGEFVGKKVRVSGEVDEFNGALQLKVASLEQLKIVE
jgi:hypothetical protein